MVVLLLDGTQHARPKNGGTQYATGEGVSPSYLPLSKAFFIFITNLVILDHMVLLPCESESYKNVTGVWLYFIERVYKW